MKKITLFLLIVISLLKLSYSQINLGLTTGFGKNTEIKVSFPNASTLRSDISSSYNMGIFVSYPIVKKITLKTELNFIKKGYILNINDTIHYSSGSKFVEKIYINNLYLENPIYLKFTPIKWIGLNFGITNNIYLYNTSYNGFEKKINIKRNDIIRTYSFGLISGISIKPTKKMDISLNFRTDLRPYYHYRDADVVINGYNYGFLLSISYQLFSF